MTTIVVRYRNSDFLRLGIYVSRRSAALKWMTLAIAVGVFVFGFSRQSASSTALLKWGGARSLRRSANAIYVGVSTSAYLILPRHSFESDEEYDSF